MVFDYTSQADNVRLLIEATSRHFFWLLQQPKLASFNSKFAQDSMEVKSKACWAIILASDVLPEYGEDLKVTRIDYT